ncbi:stability/partitioning determinant [Mesorhizobium sp. M0589]|uniref:stability/partitioning determinant n=1 Tax=Mesorhizobium sp. M0589 TaxID=2956965 RepID=UPI0033377EAE
MGEERANIFAEDDLAEFKPAPAKRPSPAVAKQAAAAAGFVSRESKVVPIAQPITPPARAPQRRHRTGRNVQFNMKAKSETIAEFVAIADAQGWVFGEALEKAVELLRAKYQKIS